MITLSLVVAMDENGLIGRDGALPWHLPDDLRQFRRITTGHAIVMGRRTHASIGRPLPDRRNVVLSRDPDYQEPGVEVVGSLGEALARLADDEEVFVIGGADVFAAALPQADRLYVTRIHAELEGDRFFPAIDLEDWRLVSEARHEADEAHAYAFTFQRFDRRRAPRSTAD